MKDMNMSDGLGLEGKLEDSDKLPFEPDAVETDAAGTEKGGAADAESADLAIVESIAEVSSENDGRTDAENAAAMDFEAAPKKPKTSADASRAMPESGYVGVSGSDFARMGYLERLRMKKEQPALYESWRVQAAKITKKGER